MMKKPLMLVLILSVASLANGSIVLMQLSVDGVVKPSNEICVWPSQNVTIDLHGFVGASYGESIVGLMIVQGPAVITGGAVLQGDGAITEIDLYKPSGFPPIAPDTLAEVLAEYGYFGVGNPALYIELYDATSPITDLDGLLVDYIQFHCEGPGDAVITFMNAETFEPYDTQIIHQIPEPATAFLLVSGITLLLRKKH